MACVDKPCTCSVCFSTGGGGGLYRLVGALSASVSLLLAVTGLCSTAVQLLSGRTGRVERGCLNSNALPFLILLLKES